VHGRMCVRACVRACVRLCERVIRVAHCQELRGYGYSFAALSARITCGLILIYNLADDDGTPRFSMLLGSTDFFHPQRFPHRPVLIPPVGPFAAVALFPRTAEIINCPGSDNLLSASFFTFGMWPDHRSAMSLQINRRI
jgi:hypothetical protein